MFPSIHTRRFSVSFSFQRRDKLLNKLLAYDIKTKIFMGLYISFNFVQQISSIQIVI